MIVKSRAVDCPNTEHAEDGRPSEYSTEQLAVVLLTSLKFKK